MTNLQRRMTKPLRVKTAGQVPGELFAVAVRNSNTGKVEAVDVWANRPMHGGAGTCEPGRANMIDRTELKLAEGIGEACYWNTEQRLQVDFAPLYLAALQSRRMRREIDMVQRMRTDLYSTSPREIAKLVGVQRAAITVHGQGGSRPGQDLVQAARQLSRSKRPKILPD
jgi:hypothetical protein